MKKRELLKRIEELEREVAVLHSQSKMASVTFSGPWPLCDGEEVYPHVVRVGDSEIVDWLTVKERRAREKDNCGPTEAAV